MWTIDELVERVGAALTAEYPGAPNGRVRDVPDRRAVRWYATTGLVDRPSAMRGRTALYEPRHLLQLVAVKRLQADGRTLAEIQAELSGATDDRLAAVARVPSELLSGSDEPSGEAARPRFWATPPTSASSSDAAWDVGRAEPRLTVADTPPAALTGVVLPGGVVLLVPGTPSPADRVAIADAARPLLDLLSSRGLTDERDSS
jgi:DNA-binding transcriptional MerR regulator